jgi:hypothetical protein
MERKNISGLLEEIKIGQDYFELKLNEDLDEDIGVLEEGIKYFKASQKLRKLVDKMSRKDIKELNPLIEITRRAAMEFEKIEGKFERGEISKSQARLGVGALKRYYSTLLQIVKKQDFSHILKVGGISVLIGGVIAAMLFGFQPLHALGVAIPTWDKVKHSFGVLESDVQKQFEAIKRAFNQKALPLIKGAIESGL